MNDPLLVRRFERLRELSGDGQRLVDRDRAMPDPLRQVLTLHQLHRERGDATDFLEAVDLRDVRVIQGGERLRFALEASQPVRISPKRLGQDLDGNIAIELGISREIPGPSRLRRSAR